MKSLSNRGRELPKSCKGRIADCVSRYGGAQLPLSNADVQALLTLAKPLRHGIGNDIVTDPAYRHVKEIATPNFSLSPDPMMQMGLLASVQARLADPGPLRAELHKLYSHGRSVHSGLFCTFAARSKVSVPYAGEVNCPMRDSRPVP